MKKLTIMMMSAALLLLGTSGQAAAAGKGGKKTKGKTEQAAADSTKKKPAKSNYEKIVGKKGCQTAKGDFITLHKVDGKLYVEYPTKYFGRDLLIGSKVNSTSDPNMVTIGYMANDPLHVKLHMKDSTVVMSQIDTSVAFDEKDKSIAEAVKKNYMDIAIRTFPVKAYTKDSSAVLLDMTDLFTGESKALSPIVVQEGLSVRTKKELCSLGDVKAYDDHVTITSEMAYSYSIKFLIFAVASGEFSANLTRTILLLPEEKAHVRVADARLGVFLQGRGYISGDQEKVKKYTIVNRWKVEPKDKAAYGRGELVEPVKPIVYYVDNTFPEAWKEPIKRGVLRWNKAFEAIGFKNVMQVKDFPENDPNFDPNSLKYTCIRYCPTDTENAMGPSWVDPRTGEIINASVIIYSDVANLINKWRFVQTAQIDPRVRASKMPKDVFDESLEYVVAHEVGHTLGLMHNMASSAAYPVDSLRSATFTAKYGTTPSIMDYARFNYVAQPGDEGVSLTPPFLGLYDYFIIKWLYTPIYGKTDKEEEQILESWVDEKAGDPMYRYGHQQIMARYDPSAIEEDLGDDPIKASDYGVKNLKYILPHLSEWIGEDPSGRLRKDMYNNIVNTYYRYMRNVMMNIGGIYLTQVKDGTPGDRFKAVPKDVQKASMKWAIDQIRNCDWIDDAELTNKFGLAVKMSANMRNSAVKELMLSSERVVISSHISDNGYTPSEYFNDLYNFVFESAIKGRKLTEGDKVLQRVTLMKLRRVGSDNWNRVELAGKYPGLMLNPDDGYNFEPTVDDIILYGLDESGIVARYADKLRDIEEIYGAGFVARNMGLGSSNIQYDFGYGFQPKLKINHIDEAPSLYLAMLTKATNLLKSRINNCHPDDKGHYMGLLYSLESIKIHY